MEKIIGIDLGTTNSVVAHIEEGEPRVIEGRNGEEVIPSIVTVTEDGNVVVGETAKNMMVQKAERTISSIKRKMGDDYAVEIDNKSYSPEQISSFTLQRLIKMAEYYTNEDINKTVITVPAYFNDRQRNATIDAGKIAGIDVERIINEPTAAAMAYGISGDEDSTILVYDLGGGTFDVSILDIGAGLYEIVGTDGINDLGGDDWTNRIVDVLKDEFEEEYGVPINSKKSERRLFTAAEEAKKTLSEKRETDIIVPFVKEVDGESANIEYNMTRTEFEDITSDLISRTKEPIEKALSESGMEVSEIDEVLLVGGSTRMPQVKNIINEKIGIKPRQDIDPDKVVAKGAAIQAAILDDKEYNSQIDDIVLLDVTPLSLGVEVEGGIFEPLIEKSTTIPAQGKKEFTTSMNDQTTVEIRIYQGERQIAEENVLLDKFKLKNIPRMRAGEPQIQVVFSVDENGVLKVKAKEKSSSIEKEIEVEGGVGMDEEQVERVKKDALRHQEEDKIERDRIRMQNLAESQVKQAENLIEYYSIPENKQNEIRSHIKDINSLLDRPSASVGKIEQNINELENTLAEIKTRYL